uniref:Putative secreted protein n=1 Tax=Xenopsylla cheopis TaxID=163159 RepID=A0A6M2E2Y7_XENCH
MGAPTSVGFFVGFSILFILFPRVCRQRVGPPAQNPAWTGKALIQWDEPGVPRASFATLYPSAIQSSARLLTP